MLYGSVYKVLKIKSNEGDRIRLLSPWEPQRLPERNATSVVPTRRQWVLPGDLHCASPSVPEENRVAYHSSTLR